MTEILFYHLERATLAQILPVLLEKSLARGWRVVLQAGTDERVRALNALLWTWRDDSFLPHGMAGEGPPDAQPVFLTDRDENPNRAVVKFCVDGAPVGDVQGFERAVYLFDGRDEVAVEQARAAWKTCRAAGHDCTYWRQSAAGKWQKQAG